MVPLSSGRLLVILGPRVGNGCELFSKIMEEIKENLLGTDLRLRGQG